MTREAAGVCALAVLLVGLSGCRAGTNYEAVALAEYLAWEDQFVKVHLDELAELKAFVEDHSE
ncbi:MAG: hypothetical protein LBG60_06080 [Bifidobacteriaceae bacterium]|nr:hypothetical protein [Bifidobacteriaceae bacterium]